MQAIEAQGRSREDRDVNCIMLFLVGGPSQLDTWDLKPEAPEEIRGPFRPIATNVPGMQITEIFPRLATRWTRSRWSARSITRRRPSTTPATR